MNTAFWRGKRVFLTGHTGFKGGWLALWLSHMGAKVKGYALPPDTSPNLFSVARVAEIVESGFGDIRDFDRLRQSMVGFDPDILIHMAAQPLVRRSYREPVETYEVNVVGTAKVLEAARSCPKLKAIISVTSDKCYENREWVWGYRENDPMGGYDPYSSSKGCAELVTAAYRRSFFQAEDVGLASVRAGNVIGGGDWAEDRLIPDILRAFEKGEAVRVRNPSAIRPWQHVLEPLSGYLVLTERLYQEPEKYAEGWNFGPYDHDARQVKWVLERMVELWGGDAGWRLDDASHPHEAGYLKLDISKARSRLGWRPTWSLSDALARVVNWHRAWRNGEDMQAYCMSEIGDFMRDMSRSEI